MHRWGISSPCWVTLPLWHCKYHDAQPSLALTKFIIPLFIRNLNDARHIADFGCGIWRRFGIAVITRYVLWYFLLSWTENICSLPLYSLNCCAFTDWKRFDRFWAGFCRLAAGIFFCHGRVCINCSGPLTYFLDWAASTRLSTFFTRHAKVGLHYCHHS